MSAKKLTHITLPGDVEREIVDEQGRLDTAGKVNKNQGVAHAGEALIIGADGMVTTGEAGVSVDATLTQEGKAADAKATGDLIAVQATQPTSPATKEWIKTGAEVEVQVPTRAAFEQLAQETGDKIDKPSAIYNGKVARAKDGDVEWVDVGQPTDEQTDAAVRSWLDEHPEATTTIVDKSITTNKFALGALHYVTPEMFGAIGDGIHDDSDYIKSAMLSGYPVKFLNKTYAVSKEIVSSCKNVIGDSTVIKLLNDVSRIFRFNGGIEYFGGIDFDLNFHGVQQAVLMYPDGNLVIENVEVCNLHDTRKELGTSTIAVYGGKTITIDNIRVHDCEHVINGIVTDGGGNVTGVYVNGYSDKCSISNTFFKEIHNIDDNGNVVMEDGGGIYVHNSSYEVPLYISNVYGYNYCKRLIKTQCLGCVFVDNVYAYTNSVDHLVCIGIQSTESEVQTKHGVGIVSNCMLVNDYVNNSVSQYLIASSEDLTVTNCTFYSKSQPIVSLIGSINIKGCNFYGNGILISSSAVNPKLYVGDSYFKSHFVLYTNATITNPNVEFSNCVIEYDADGYVNYPFIEIKAPVMIRESRCINTSIALWDNSIIDSVIVDNGRIDAFVVKGVNVVLRNVVAHSPNTGRCINVMQDAECRVENITISGYSISIAGTGNIHVGPNISPEFLIYKTCNIVSCYPQYVSSLPASGNYKTENAVVVNMVDGKMYKCKEGNWVVL